MPVLMQVLEEEIDVLKSRKDDEMNLRDEKIQAIQKQMPNFMAQFQHHNPSMVSIFIPF